MLGEKYAKRAEDSDPRNGAPRGLSFSVSNHIAQFQCAIAKWGQSGPLLQPDCDVVARP